MKLETKANTIFCSIIILAIIITIFIIRYV